MDKVSKQPEGILAPYRVLDLTDDLGFLCGKILGDMGADVIKVEPPGGDPSRNIGPFVDGVLDPEKSLYWFAYNTSKRGITLNLTERTGQELFKRLARKADFVIESFPPGTVESWGLGYETLKRENPRILLTSITFFGQTGPYSRYKASDIEIMATSGAMSLSGERNGPPLRISFPQSAMWTGMHAAAGTLLAHYERELSGEGQHVDVSAQASTLSSLAHAPACWDLNRDDPHREGILMTGRSITGAVMQVFWPCQDGYINFIVYGGPAGRKTNLELVKWMDSKGMAPAYLKEIDWDKFDISTATQEQIDAIEKPAGEFLKTLTKAEYFAGVVERGMLGYPVQNPEDIFNDPQLEARNFWVSLPHPELGREITYPGAAALFSQGSCTPRCRAPLIGEHNREIYEGELGLSHEELTILKQAGVI